MTDLDLFTSILDLCSMFYQRAISSDGRLIHIFVGDNHTMFWLKTERIRYNKTLLSYDSVLQSNL